MSGASAWRQLPPADAVSLAELIADSGPLPPDVALECVQRLSERLDRERAVECERLTPSDVLIDDDGGIWLRQSSLDAPVSPAVELADEMDQLGRILVFLATGESSVQTERAIDLARLPPSLAPMATRLFSRNGSCYRTFAELACDAAALRGCETAPAVEIKDDRQSTVVPVSEAIAPADELLSACEPRGAVPRPSASPGTASPLATESIGQEVMEPEVRSWRRIAFVGLLMIVIAMLFAFWRLS